MIKIQDKIEAENMPLKMILQVHDELVFELPASEAGKYSSWIQDEMSRAMDLSLKLKVDVTTGPSWQKS